MLTLGIVILLVGLIVLAIGRGTRTHIAVVIGTYTAIGGAVLLAVGLILYFVHAADDSDLDIDAAPPALVLQ